MSKPNNHVIIVTCPEGWTPRTFHAVPPEFVSTTFYSRHLPLHECISIARAFNQHHFGQRFDGRWAVVTVSVRRNPFKPKAGMRCAVGWEGDKHVPGVSDGTELANGDTHDEDKPRRLCGAKLIRSGVVEVSTVANHREGGAA